MEGGEPMENRRNYLIVSRYMREGIGWTEDTQPVNDSTMQAAWREASAIAKALDDEYGDSHFWNVQLESEDHGAIVQLFHGRLS
jgi:hypothetical protein